tara:strand:- start:805 stop:1581 length:777 start_codon:yes stop_codon:yes gene_type:complete
MIHNLLPIVCSELNDYFKSRYGLREDRLVLSNLIDQDGSVAFEGSNTVVCSLVNVEEETTLKATAGTTSLGGAFVKSSPDIYVNLTVIFSSYFVGKNYVEALKFLSGVIYFFQGKPIFTNDNTPGLSDNVEKAVFDLTSLSFHDLSAVFQMMGSKYLPSVVYRIRMLTFSTDNMEDTIPSISGIGIAPEEGDEALGLTQGASGKSAVEDAFNRERQRVDETKKKMIKDDGDAIEDDPFEQSRDRNNLRKPSDKNDDKE